ncbi:MAG TPA: hypothetical protein VD905_07850, partial [Flavobacteriales bacterium]|nr:hypothetical protein [Flavobacteriales bacterium]
MIIAISKSKWFKKTAVTLALLMATEMFYPTAAYALTGGPSQPEVQSFTPVGVSDMVDLFSGDFHYNIPLMDAGGYPINMSYSSGVTMDQEASWVGLGWNLNTGSITRNMRGLPDDFDGDQVAKEFNMLTNRTYGLTVGIGYELFGGDFASIGYSLGVNYNNYNGVGFEQSVTPTISMGAGEKGKLNMSLGISASSGTGLDIRPSLSYSKQVEDENNNIKNLGSNIGVSINNRAGLTNFTFGLSASQTDKKDVAGRNGVTQDLTHGQNAGGHISFVNQTYVPSYEMPRNNYSVTVSAKLGPTIVGIDGLEATLSGYYNETSLSKKTEVVPAYGYLNEGNGASLEKVLLDFNREKDGGFTRSTMNLPLANNTYDVFSIAGQGIGGSFRAFRGDIGYLFDPSSKSTSVGAS